jgi:Tfp pilus assembly protein PilF
MPNTKKLVFQWLCPLLLLTAPSLNAESKCTQIVAKVASAQGVVVLRAYQSKEWRRVYSDEPICAGSTIKTLVRSRATLIESSLAVITLDQHSTLTFVAPPAQDKVSSWFINLLEGKFLFRSRETQKLNIQTPFINAVHEGTEFIVAVNEKKAEISVLDGQVAGENSAGKIKIAKGYKGVAEAGQQPVVKALSITPDDAVQWALYYPPIIDVSPQTQVGSSINSALMAYRQGDITEALAKLDQVPASIQDRIQHHILKSGLLLTTGRLDEAQPLIDHVLQQQPNNSEALALQSIIAVTKNQQDYALNWAKKAVSNNPGSAVAQIAQSYAQQALFNLDDALKSAQEATRISPENALAWARVAELQLSQGDHAAALASAQKAQVANPKLARTQTILGFANLAETKISNAQHAFQDAISLDSSDPLARLGLGLAKIRQGDVEDGKTELETAVNLDPNNALVRSYLGKAYYELRNKDYAGKEYEIAKQMDPKDPTPYFYDAILKQTTNRPVEALHDMQKAIELNDNRGVYRSKLVLDSDKAARSASLGRIFKDLGFQRLGQVEGWKSLNIDPSNHSAHRLLSDNYANLPRHEIARVSELLQAQLLQPNNLTALQPQLVESRLGILNGAGPSFQSTSEFNSLYERNGASLLTNQVFGTQDTYGDDVVLSGVFKDLSFSLGQYHFNTDGYRANNDQTQNSYNALIQYALTDDTQFQFEYRHSESQNGDLSLLFDRSRFSSSLRESERKNTYRVGGHHKFAPNSDLIVSAIYQDSQTASKQTDQIPGIDVNGGYNGYQVEAQHLFQLDQFKFISGAGYLEQKNRSTTLIDLTPPFLPPFSLSPFIDKQKQAVTHVNGYLYTHYLPFTILDFTFGLSVNAVENEFGENIQLNPKFGLIWQVNNYLTLRGAAFRTMTRDLLGDQTIEPTQVAGFNQFFRDSVSTESWRYGLAADIKLQPDLYAGMEVSLRDQGVPYLQQAEQPGAPPTVNSATWRESGARAYLNWTPTNWLALGMEYQFDKFEEAREFTKGTLSLKTHRLPLTMSLFHSCGAYLKLEGTYYNQAGKFIETANSGAQATQQDNDFWLANLSMGYRLPKRYGKINLSVLNVFDQDFNFQDFSAANPMIMPERSIFGTFTLSF